ncbi:hypothetical protein [Achromobacter deleyi]|nr:hypothetical protein [Achromobacter deleyi]
MDRNPGLVTGLECRLADAQIVDEAARLMVLEGLAVYWPSDYWPSLAISWLEDGFALDDEIAGLLEAASANKGWSQQVRHRAFALWVKWKRARP